MIGVVPSTDSFPAALAQARRGWTWSQLTVDTANVTGAPARYAAVGMNPVEVIDLYRLLLGRP
jgi:hypothetical protein